MIQISFDQFTTKLAYGEWLSYNANPDNRVKHHNTVLSLCHVLTIIMYLNHVYYIQICNHTLLHLNVIDSTYLYYFFFTFLQVYHIFPNRTACPNRTTLLFEEWKYAKNDSRVVLIHVKCKIGYWILEKKIAEEG